MDAAATACHNSSGRADLQDHQCGGFDAFSETDPTVSNASTSPGLLTKWIVSAFFVPSVRYDCILCLRIEFEPL
jgi:hypothetical protein